MHESPRNIFVRNLANITSVLGVLPLCILFLENGYQYLLPLIVYNNIMDDLDGVLASKLNVKSSFGALLDNVCDAIAHTVFVMVVGMNYAQETGFTYVGGICLASSLVAAVAMIVRVVSRLQPTAVAGIGTPTNELIRHMFFVVLIAQALTAHGLVLDPTPFLIAVFAIHSVSMLVRFKVPYLIRTLSKSATSIGLVNVALIVAYFVPYAAIGIGALFFSTYLCSFLIGGINGRGK